jgi:hypothetical protein
MLGQPRKSGMLFAVKEQTRLLETDGRLTTW